MQFNHDTMDISPKWILTKEYKSRIIDFYILLDFLFIIILLLYYITIHNKLEKRILELYFHCKLTYSIYIYIQ